LRVANGFGLFRWPRSVLDIDDLPSSLHRTNRAQAANVFDRFRYHRRMMRWRRREKFLLQRFDALCVCSEPDRRELGSADRIFVLPNGFDAPPHLSPRRPAVPPRVGFAGILNYAPNQEGVRWFLQRVWPLVLQVVPQATLRLAGAGSEKEIWRTHPNVEGLGWIAGLESEMATWSLAVVPVFVGGGMRIKIAEAFSRRCPVVSTTLGAHGYDVADGREILLADSAGDFAVKCLRLLADPAGGAALAENARRKFLENWTWDSFANRVAGVVETVLQKPVHSSCQ
jgi:glycosyltransferase involved in cell wall biosynthesis